MKKYISIILALMILATNLPNNQGLRFVFQMAAFVHHFVHHVYCEKEDIGIIEFVKLHYFDSVHYAEDMAEHEKLPFQHQHQQDQQTIVPQMLCLLPSFYAIPTFRNVEITIHQLIIRSQTWQSSPSLADIWQLPRLSVVVSRQS